MNFDPLAKYYDTIAGLVYWGAIQRSQLVFLDQIKPQSKILIIGGGTGWILNHIPSDCTSLTYIEPSAEMMKISRSRKTIYPVQYIEDQVERTSLDTDFDVIITNFFFDQFDRAEGANIAMKIRGYLKEDGTWILTEFEDNGKWWQKILLKSMYLFFAKTTGLKPSQLPPWKDIMDSIEMRMKSYQSCFGNFIVSVCYK